MNLQASHLFNFKVFEEKKKLGFLYDLLFDERTWEILYFSINKGNLLNPDLVTFKLNRDSEFDTVKKILKTTRVEQVFDKPIMHPDYELTPALAWPNLWSISESDEEREMPENKKHLRSIREVLGYYVKTEDGNISGYVTDFIIDINEMKILNIIIRTSKVLPIGKQIALDVNTISFNPVKTEILYINRNQRVR